ncbi:MAG TPA: thioredoxin domain-containing protein [Burkholderiales bacterium]|nr:thioredoxin domain-containing protein [Burkholderiales bacterium]
MSNHLANETSPYLLQHAENPVNWYPWGDEALRLSRQQDRPILLSIGYSACHWCHVMAHESFEDSEVAKLMNEHFINIKVDREERPDLDQIYQTAQYMLTQRTGGWPLTMFLTPDQKPFFGGTYFPKEARYNLPGFGDLLKRVADFYHQHRDEIDMQSQSLLAALQRTLPETAQQVVSAEPLQQLLEQLHNGFDPLHGGFGDAPKFPHTAEIEFCLRRFAAGRDDNALHMATFTLEKIAMGGIYDQLGGGFCRYSVDQNWMIPHFEKMLYDNGPLLRLYSDAWQVTHNPLFKNVTEETAAWVMREMQSAEGGYYSTLDADSEHEEGKFYTWVRDEVATLLNTEEYSVAAAHYGLADEPNFEGKLWHLHVKKSASEVANALSVPQQEVEQRLASARSKLFAAREKRVHPGRDEKILTSWNALMIKGMAHAARVFANPDWLLSAQRASDFIQSSLWRNRRLFATCKSASDSRRTEREGTRSTGRAHLNAYLDDYAFLLDALLELLQTEFRGRDLEFATQLAQVMLAQFQDREFGGFFFTSHDHEKLIHRPKSGYDGATPSGNGVAAFALLRLGHILGNRDYLKAAEDTLKLFYPELSRRPGGYTSMIMALEEILRPPQVIILRGQKNSLDQWQRELQQDYLPRALILALPDNLEGLPQMLDRKAAGPVHAWVCVGDRCLAPISDLQRLKQLSKSDLVP